MVVSPFTLLPTICLFLFIKMRAFEHATILSYPRKFVKGNPVEKIKLGASAYRFSNIWWCGGSRGDAGGNQ